MGEVERQFIKVSEQIIELRQEVSRLRTEVALLREAAERRGSVSVPLRGSIS